MQLSKGERKILLDEMVPFETNNWDLGDAMSSGVLNAIRPVEKRRTTNTGRGEPTSGFPRRRGLRGFVVDDERRGARAGAKKVEYQLIRGCGLI